MREGESICDFTDKNGDGGDGFLQFILVVKIGKIRCTEFHNKKMPK